MQLRVGVDGADAAFNLAQLGLGHEIGLVENDHIGKGDLVLGFGRVLQAVAQPFRVGNRHHGIETRTRLHIVVNEEGLRDRCRVRETGRLHDDRVELAAPFHQTLDDADEIAANGAADATVVHLEHFLIGAHDEVVVDANLAEFVHDNRELKPVLLAQDTIEQGRLAGTQIAGENGDGDLVGHVVSHFRCKGRLERRIGALRQL